MKRLKSMTRPFAVAIAVGLLCSSSAYAQLDRVYSLDGDSVTGTISSVTKDGIELQKAGNKQEIRSNDISKIQFDGDPTPLIKARGFVLDGQYDQALTELKSVNASSINRAEITADFDFYLALCVGKLALAGKGNKGEAGKAALGFASKHPNSWHFYEATRLLGDLSLATNDHDNAMKYYRFLEQSKSGTTKMQSVYLVGLVHLKKAEGAEALAEFDKIVSANPQSSQGVRIQILAKAGRAVALSMTGKGAEGKGIVTELIKTLNPTDTEMSARIYNALGASNEASGDKEAAVMGYLHTHLMFSGQPDAHAEALKRLAVLWDEIGQPSRAAEARQELQTRYPGF